MSGNIQVRANQDFGNTAKVVNLVDGTDPQDAVTKSQLDAAIESVVIAWKEAVRVATVSNIDLSSAPAAIDGVTLASGDRVLVKDQTTAAENGIYVFTAAASPMTRATDADNFEELEVAVVPVEEGTSNEGTFWRQTQLNGVIDTNDVIFQNFLSAVPSATETTEGTIEIATQVETDAGTDDVRAVTPFKLANSVWAKRKISAQFGDGVATQYDITHNFGTRDVQVEVYETASPFDTVLARVERFDVNTVRICTAAAPTTNELTAVIMA